MPHPRRLPIGAEVQPEGGAHFRVWAPRRKRVEVVLERTQRRAPLEAEADGYFAGFVADARADDLYRYRLDDGDAFPDPASRFQPEGPHGPSQIVDPSRFEWTDQQWRGVNLKGQVIYEMHIGAFTREGTWEAAAARLPDLADLGVTVLEVMPIADFPGDFGWGYDGVNMFAPTRLYGKPDDVRRFIDRAHAVGLGVILDVVYNHLGPDGNYLGQYSAHYVTDRYKNEWGEALNFDDDNAGPSREFFACNAGYWIDEFHFDGLRLDATQQIFDGSSEHIHTAIMRRVREAARGRGTIVVAENESQEAKLVRAPEQGGHGIDGIWNDDFHHTARVAMTGYKDAYYSDYFGSPQEFISAVKWGFIFQGQRYQWQEQRRGTPSLDIPPERFVICIQNHDQVANSGRGLRAHRLTSPGRYRAMTALLLLAPQTPMLFQGQEFAAESPFLFFAHHNPELAKLVRKGRKEFLAQFRNLALPPTQETLDDPEARATFERCKLDWADRERNAEILRLHRDLLRLRREDPVLRLQRPRGVDGAVLGSQAFVLRYFADDGDDRLLVVNLGRDLHLDPAPEPLLAPPLDKAWATVWSSDDLAYGGLGTPPLDTEENWRIPGEAAVVLRPKKDE